MDIRKDFSNVLDKYGYDVIYVRRDKRFHCECFSERSGGLAQSDCPKCFGTGYVIGIEKVRTRRKISSVPESLVRARKNFEVGFIPSKAFVFYMEHDIHPAEGDLVLEVEWNDGIPIRIINKNVISIADPQYGDQGRIEFYQVYSRFEPIKVVIKMPSPTIEYNQHQTIESFSMPTIGKRLVLVGEAEAGPYYEPTMVSNIKIAENLFQSGPLLDRFADIQLVDKSIEVIFVRIHKSNFDMAYRCLQPYTFDLVYLDDFNFGSSREEIDDFIDFAKEKESQGQLIHGFFNLDDSQDLTEINNIIASFTFEDMLDIHEFGKYISVVYDQFYDHQAAAVYAGLVTSLEPGVSPVNKTLDVTLRKKWKKKR